jgi:hypothetical protein
MAAPVEFIDLADSALGLSRHVLIAKLLKVIRAGASTPVEVARALASESVRDARFTGVAALATRSRPAFDALVEHYVAWEALPEAERQRIKDERARQHAAAWYGAQ